MDNLASCSCTCFVSKPVTGEQSVNAVFFFAQGAGAEASMEESPPPPSEAFLGFGLRIIFAMNNFPTIVFCFQLGTQRFLNYVLFQVSSPKIVPFRPVGAWLTRA